MNGGLQLLEDYLRSHAAEPGSGEFVAAFMSIMEAITPYLLNRTVDRFGEKIIKLATQSLLANGSDVLRTISLEMMKSLLGAIQILAKRLYSTGQASEIYETFFLNISVACIKTDFLERKLNGVSFLGEIYKGIKSKDYIHVTKKDLVHIIETGRPDFTQKISSSRSSKVTHSSSLSPTSF